MTKTSILASLRKQLMESGSSEAEVLADGALQDLFENIQALTLEMNEAKKAAAAEAAQPYLETIEKAEKQYAMMVKLSATRSSK